MLLVLKNSFCNLVVALAFRSCWVTFIFSLFISLFFFLIVEQCACWVAFQRYYLRKHKEKKEKRTGTIFKKFTSSFNLSKRHSGIQLMFHVINPDSVLE